jgi:hypothetical protein
MVGEAKVGHEEVAMAKKFRPTLVLMDVTGLGQRRQVAGRWGQLLFRVGFGRQRIHWP